MPAAVAVGPVQAPVVGVGAVAQLGHAHLGPFDQVRVPRRAAVEDGNRVAADVGFNADLVVKAGWDPTSTVLAAKGVWSKTRPVRPMFAAMSVAATPVPLSEAKARLSELARRVRQQHERITLSRNGEPEAVLLSVDDLEGLEATLEILGDSETGARISESLAALERGEPGADLAAVRNDLVRRRDTGA